MDTSIQQADTSGSASAQSDEELNRDTASKKRVDEASILDMLLVLVRNSGLILWTVVVVGGVGLSYAVLAPEEYLSTAKVIPESQEGGVGSQLAGGLGLVQGLGINLDGTGGGLSPSSYPSVLDSRDVKLAVVRDTFSFPDAARPMTFVEYIDRPKSFIDKVFRYTIFLPWTLKDSIGELVSSSPSVSTVQETETQAVKRLTEAEYESIAELENMIETSIDQGNGWMEISATADNPELAAELVQSLLDHLRTRIQSLRTEKVRKQLQFIESRFVDAGNELESAEDELAQFLERNQNPTTAALAFQRDRLQRQVRFKEQLYSELQNQLTQTRLDLQRQQPVVTVVEQPAIPVKRSAPPRTLIVIMCVLAGGVLGVCAAFGKTFLKKIANERDKKEKVEEILKIISFTHYYSRIGKEKNSSHETSSGGASDEQR